MKVYSWEEVRTSCEKESKSLVVIEDVVYDLTQWKHKHPGGRKIIDDHIGFDATDSFLNFHHSQKSKILQQYSKAFAVGRIETDPDPLIEEYRNLHQKYAETGMFQANYLWYFLQGLHIVITEAIAFLILYLYGIDRVSTFLITAILMAISHAQAGWLQHDFGHLSVFEHTSWNRFWHIFFISAMKGASNVWWNMRHNRHHAKPNIYGKDPDIHNEPFIIFGDDMADKKMGWKYTKYQPYYWFLLGPPLVTSVIFIITNIRYVIVYNLKLGRALTVFAILRYFVPYILLGKVSIPLVIFHFFFWRVIESMWFTWITAMNHFPMKIGHDQNLNFVEQQLITTQNTNPGILNNWISGHLNYQIEHHLFPCMPRHNYPKIASDVRQMVERHGIEYRTKTMYGAMCDIVDSLKIAAEVHQKKKIS
eukprot:TRINITY_DN8269_c0_g1_i1.p1 TRINITY_DN8269_c0_g1~~TRINITY_DN8269_c0_g1_i1.p1  ORF type:complete len:421 (-),score=48.21 TRINITY_DN8269_c0_g1_i1:20-1282(-)